ncbi:MAG TPA: DNA-directed RNA polymerase subunit alpha [Candidatus Paceibacterota bacterium]|nr:DNA-directed RNA polymerase subunit alpha [Candidatus Paceibacterota bacterium]HPT40500.1 DNA-directed RNA polymerase subunit alpha [Candidatus Paceibacterota bacterium]
MEFVLPSKTNIIKEDGNLGVFEIEGLYPGYGLTVGIALRRVLLSSLPGSVITTVKIKGVQHEFSTIPHIKEDVIQILLNLKKIRVKTFSNEPQTLTLLVKGEKKVFASDIEKNSAAEIINADAFIATLTDKKAELEIIMTVESGLGYVPAEAGKKEKLPIGTLSLDALFSPIRNINYEVEDMRVGERTDYNRLRLHIETDGSISPRQAFKKACEILTNHFQVIGDVEVPEEKAEVAEEESKSEKKTEKKAKKAKK